MSQQPDDVWQLSCFANSMITLSQIAPAGIKMQTDTDLKQSSSVKKKDPFVLCLASWDTAAAECWCWITLSILFAADRD